MEVSFAYLVGSSSQRLRELTDLCLITTYINAIFGVSKVNTHAFPCKFCNKCLTAYIFTFLVQDDCVLGDSQALCVLQIQLVMACILDAGGVVERYPDASSHQLAMWRSAMTEMLQPNRHQRVGSTGGKNFPTLERTLRYFGW